MPISLQIRHCRCCIWATITMRWTQCHRSSCPSQPALCLNRKVSSAREVAQCNPSWRGEFLDAIKKAFHVFLDAVEFRRTQLFECLGGNCQLPTFLWSSRPETPSRACSLLSQLRLDEIGLGWIRMDYTQTRSIQKNSESGVLASNPA